MSPRKKDSTKSKRNGEMPRRKLVVLEGGEIEMLDQQHNAEGDDPHPHPTRRNPEPSPEETTKRLARRKTLTLRAFQKAYENHHSRRKAS